MPERITHENVIGVVVMVNRDNNEHGVFVLSKTNTYKMRMDVEVYGAMAIEKKTYEWIQVDTIHNETVLIKGYYLETVNTIINAKKYNNNDIKPIRGGISIKVKSLDNENESDSINCETDIFPKGFPNILSVVTNYTGNEIPLSFKMVGDVIPDSFQIKSNIFTSLYTLIKNSCDSLVEEIHGSFEQIADIIYSKILLLKYMKNNKINDENVSNENIKSLEYYYKELLKFQTIDGGFEWFGKAPSNEGLTAYGIMVLNEVKNIIKIDENVINKARNWLLNRQLENGYFNTTNNENINGLGVVGNSSTTSFIYWVLSEDKTMNITNKFLKYYDSLSDVRNSYIIGLLGLTYYNLEGMQEDSDNMGLLLTKLFNEDGSIKGVLESIIGSNGENIIIETTCICILLYMKLNQFVNYIPFVDKSVEYLHSKNKNGMIGNSHSTVLALKVFMEYEKYKNIKQIENNPDDNIKIDSYYNSVMIGSEPISNFSSHSLLSLSPYTQLVKTDQNSLNFKSDTILSNYYKFGLTLHFNSENNYNNDEKCNVRILYQLSKEAINQDNDVDLIIRVQNNNNSNKLGMVVAVIDIPGGLKLDDNELNRLIKNNVFDQYENKGNELVLYWRGMVANDVKTFLIHGNGVIPGNYKAKASYIYEYYNNNLKWYINGLEIIIMPRV